MSIQWLIHLENDKIVRYIPLQESKYTLGRGTENNIVFEIPKVSRLHAILVKEQESYHIIDNNIICYSVINDTLWKSVDGGINWLNKQELWWPKESYRTAKKIYFINAAKGFVLIQRDWFLFSTGAIYQTIDAGDSWTMKTLNYPLIDINFADHNFGYTYGWHPVFFPA